MSVVPLAQVACKNNLLVLYVRTRLAANGVLKGFLRKGDSQLAEINLLYLCEQKQIFRHGKNMFVLTGTRDIISFQKCPDRLQCLPSLEWVQRFFPGSIAARTWSFLLSSSTEVKEWVDLYLCCTPCLLFLSVSRYSFWLTTRATFV
jgi:hypothetical protein